MTRYMGHNHALCLLFAVGLLSGSAGPSQDQIDSESAASALSPTQQANQAAPASQPRKPATQQLLQEGEKDLAAKDYEDAVQNFKKAIKTENEKCSECYLALAEAQVSMDDVKSALNNCDKAIHLAKTNGQRAEGHSAKGDTLIRSGLGNRLKEAEREYREAIQLDPDAAAYHIRMAIALFKESRDSEGKEELTAYLELAPMGQFAVYAKALRDNPRRAREEYAPEFQVTTIKGQNISSQELLGRLVVLDFWTTWCSSCKDALPVIKALTKEYSSGKLVVLSVSADRDEALWREFVQKNDMDWPQYRDTDNHLLKLLGVHLFPSYVVIDAEGIIRERIVEEDPRDPAAGRLKNALLKILPQGPMPRP
jgi:peroxiredoxin